MVLLLILHILSAYVRIITKEIVHSQKQWLFLQFWAFQFHLFSLQINVNQPVIVYGFDGLVMITIQIVLIIMGFNTVMNHMYEKSLHMKLAIGLRICYLVRVISENSGSYWLLEWGYELILLMDGLSIHHLYPWPLVLPYQVWRRYQLLQLIVFFLMGRTSLHSLFHATWLGHQLSQMVVLSLSTSFKWSTLQIIPNNSLGLPLTNPLKSFPSNLEFGVSFAITLNWVGSVRYVKNVFAFLVMESKAFTGLNHHLLLLCLYQNKLQSYRMVFLSRIILITIRTIQLFIILVKRSGQPFRLQINWRQLYNDLLLDEYRSLDSFLIHLTSSV